jgi:AcrR family transcriptional regulator
MTLPTPSPARTARERVRHELTNEIKAVARAQLATSGGAGLSVRAVAREMGMASSALFRYFPNRDALLTALIIDSYGALADEAEAAEARVHDGSVLDRWMAICHGVREWALAQPQEYALIFGSPIPGYAAPQDTIAPATRVPLLLGGLLVDRAREDPTGAATGASPQEVVDAVAHMYRDGIVPPEVPADLVVRGLMGWTYLFGAVSFEVFGHRHNVILDYRAFFDLEIRRVAQLLGLG